MFEGPGGWSRGLEVDTSFARKLALSSIASALALGALCILLVRGREASREPVPGEAVPAVAGVEAMEEPLAVEKPSTPARPRKEMEPTAATTSSDLQVVAGEIREEIDAELPGGGTIEGHVFLAASGEPIENAKVAFSIGTSDPWEQFPRAVATRADGYFVLEGVPEGEVTIAAFHPEHAPRIVEGVRTRASDRISVRVDLGAGGIVRGRVMRSDEPVVSVQVRAVPRSGGPGGSAQTGPDGSFELEGLASGYYAITVEESERSGARARRIVNVVEGRVTEIDLECEAAVRLGGRITAGDGAVPGGRVQVRRRGQADKGTECEIGPGGEYSLDLPGAGIFMLVIGSRSLGGMTRLDIVVPPGSTEVRRDIELPSGRVTGTVVDGSTGRPLPNVEVGAFAEDARSTSIVSLFEAVQAMGRTDDQGRFALSGLPDGSHDVRAFARGYIQVRRESIEVERVRGARDIEVALEKALPFRVRAEDPDGKPLRGAVALLRGADGDLIVSGPLARSGRDGMLDVHVGVPGAYRITVLHLAHAPARATITVLEDGSVSPGSVFRLEEGGRIRVRVTSGSEAVHGATAEVIDDAGDDFMNDVGFDDTPLATGPDGLLEVGPLPAGVYEVSVKKDGRRSKVEKIVVRERETSEETFTIE